MGPIAYIALKYVAYAGWCFVDLSLLSATSPVSLSRALGFGLFRLLLGFMFGLGIYLVGSIVYSALVDAPATGLLTYLAVYVPVRWIEWSILGILIAPSGWFAHPIFFQKKILKMPEAGLSEQQLPIIRNLRIGVTSSSRSLRRAWGR